MTNDNISALARDWIEAKRVEEAARAQRHEIEAQLAQALETKDEGSITHIVGDYRITLRQGLARKVDPNTWTQVAEHCPPDMRPVKIKLEADPTGCKYLAANEPEIWSKISSAFEVKPQKIGVQIK